MKRRNFIGYGLLLLGGCTAATTTTPTASFTINRPTQLRFAVTDISGLDELKQNYEAFRIALEEIRACHQLEG